MAKRIHNENPIEIKKRNMKTHCNIREGKNRKKQQDKIVYGRFSASTSHIVSYAVNMLNYTENAAIMLPI